MKKLIDCVDMRYEDGTFLLIPRQANEMDLVMLGFAGTENGIDLNVVRHILLDWQMEHGNTMRQFVIRTARLLLGTGDLADTILWQTLSTRRRKKLSRPVGCTAIVLALVSQGTDDDTQNCKKTVMAERM